MNRNFGVQRSFQRHPYQPVTWRMRLDDAADAIGAMLARALKTVLALAIFFFLLWLGIHSARADENTGRLYDSHYSKTGARAHHAVRRLPPSRRHAASHHRKRPAPVPYTVHRAHHRPDANGNRAEIIGGRPAGCPHAYCGCGLRKYLGIADTRLNLAWNWTKYYRGSQPVAVWHHHVALIERMVGPRTALLRDYNSGGGLSRLHVRSISGARIVNGYGREARL